MDEQRREQIIRESRALADSPRYPEAGPAEVRERIEREMAANRQWIAESIASEPDETSSCDEVSAQPEPPPTPEPPAADEGREFNMELVGDVIAETMAQFVGEQIRMAKIEVFTELNAMRMEFLKEQSAFVREQKIMLANVRDLLSKIKDREFRGEELPSSLN
jgi:hypothetical protein